MSPGCESAMLLPGTHVRPNRTCNGLPLQVRLREGLYHICRYLDEQGAVITVFTPVFV